MLQEDNSECSSDPGGRDWRKIVEEFDKKQEEKDRLFNEHNLVVPFSGLKSLSDDENEILNMVLCGTPIKDIADFHAISVELTEAIIDEIKDKLSDMNV